MPRRNGLLLAIIAVLGVAGLTSTAAAGAGAPGQRNLVANGGFERGLAGWAGWQSSLARRSNGAVGRTAARIVARRGVRDYSIVTASRPVSATAAGRVYLASGWTRSQRGRRTVCLAVREWAGAKVVDTARSCVTATRSWRRFPRLEYRAKGVGHELDLFVYRWGRVSAGDSFDVDGLSLVAAPAASAAPSAPAVPASPTGRPYAASSPWNTPIPQDARPHPESAAMVSTVVQRAGSAGWPVAANKWTVPVYAADASTPRRDVKLVADWAPRRTLLDVPIPANAQPDPEGDGHIAIVDRSTGCEYDFWQARKDGDGSWSASWGNALPLGGSGWYERGLAARAAGPGLLGGLILPDELRAGRIDHALAFAHSAVRKGLVTDLATDGSGATDSAGAIPYGARLQLDPSLDVDSLGLSPWQKTIARALQVYGMILVDQGGFGLYAAHRQAYASDPYAGVLPDGEYAYMPKALAAHLRVLDHGSLKPRPRSEVVANGCNRFR